MCKQFLTLFRRSSRSSVSEEQLMDPFMSVCLSVAFFLRGRQPAWPGVIFAQQLDQRGEWEETGENCKMRNFIICTFRQMLLSRSNHGGWDRRGLGRWERKETMNLYRRRCQNNIKMVHKEQNVTMRTAVMGLRVRNKTIWVAASFLRRYFTAEWSSAPNDSCRWYT
jgi:hypothetical protein